MYGYVLDQPAWMPSITNSTEQESRERRTLHVTTLAASESAETISEADQARLYKQTASLKRSKALLPISRPEAGLPLTGCRALSSIRVYFRPIHRLDLDNAIHPHKYASSVTLSDGKSLDASSKHLTNHQLTYRH